MQDSHSTASLIQESYRRLRQLARQQLDAGGSISPTDLVHEVFLRMEGHEWESDLHFRRTAVKAMRQIIVDRARRRGAAKRGGGAVRVTLRGVGEVVDPVDALALDAVIAKLHEADARRGQVAELVVFGGFSQEEVAELLGASVRTVQRDWRVARALLRAELLGG
mgnify:CR=1 FL=1